MANYPLQTSKNQICYIATLKYVTSSAADAIGDYNVGEVITQPKGIASNIGDTVWYRVTGFGLGKSNERGLILVEPHTIHTAPKRILSVNIYGRQLKVILKRIDSGIGERVGDEDIGHGRTEERTWCYGRNRIAIGHGRNNRITTKTSICSDCNGVVGIGRETKLGMCHAG